MDRLTAIYYILQGVGTAIAAIAHLVEVLKGKGHDTAPLEAPVAVLRDAHAQAVTAVQAATAAAPAPKRV